MNVKIKISNNLKNVLSHINDKVSNLILSLNDNGIDDIFLNNNYPNYLDIDYDNSITYISNNVLEKIKKDNGIVTSSLPIYTWNNRNRQKTKMVRLLRKIMKENYLNERLTNQDIELFVGKCDSIRESFEIKEYRGRDILEAFNYNGRIDLDKFGESCANFKQNLSKKGTYPEPKVKWFNFYIHNPSISVLTLEENGIIRARSVIFKGIQMEDNGDYKKGVEYSFMNSIYSEGNFKYKKCLMEEGAKRGYIHNGIDLKTNKLFNGSIIIPIRTHYKTYPPVDSLYVETKKKILSNNYSKGFKSAYKLVQ